MSKARSADVWRKSNIGRLLNNAVRRFEARVLELMTERGYAATRIAHLNLTRNLDRAGNRATELAQRAAMTKQAMAELIGHLEDLGLVARKIDPTDTRARIVHFTSRGLKWLDAFRKSVDEAEVEMARELGAKRHRTVRESLEIYTGAADPKQNLHRQARDAKT